MATKHRLLAAGPPSSHTRRGGRRVHRWGRRSQGEGHRTYSGAENQSPSQSHPRPTACHVPQTTQGRTFQQAAGRRLGHSCSGARWGGRVGGGSGLRTAMEAPTPPPQKLAWQQCWPHPLSWEGEGRRSHRQTRTRAQASLETSWLNCEDLTPSEDQVARSPHKSKTTQTF